MNEAPSAPSISGKVIILAIAGVAVLAASASWLYYARLQRRPLEFWGSRTAALLMRAPQVELSSAGEPAEGGAVYDVADAPGFSHLRQALVNDVSFEWASSSPPDDVVWTHRLTFRDGAEETFVELTEDGAWVAGPEGRAMRFVEPVGREFETFLKRRSAEPATKTGGQ